jgi:hypothetical protein
VRRSSLVVACWFACWFASADAHAQNIAWRAQADCTREGFDAELARLLAGSPALQRPFAAEVRLGKSFVMELRLEHAGARSERTLRLASCSDAQRASALLIATAIDPERTQLSQSTPSPAAPEPAVAAPPVVPAPVAAAPTAPEPAASEPGPPAPPVPAPSSARVDVAARPRDAALRIGAQLAVASLPGVSAGPVLGGQLALGSLLVSLDGRYLFARRTRDGDSGLRADVDLFSAAAAASWRWRLGPLALGPLVELELGVLRAVGQGESAARSARAPWFSGALGLQLQPAVGGRISASLFALASVPFWRPGLQLGDEASFYTTSAVAFRLGIVVLLSVRSTSAARAGQ